MVPIRLTPSVGPYADNAALRMRMYYMQLAPGNGEIGGVQTDICH